MKAFLVSIVAMAVISAGAWFVLEQVGPSAAEQAAKASVRLE